MNPVRFGWRLCGYRVRAGRAGRREGSASGFCA